MLWSFYNTYVHSIIDIGLSVRYMLHQYLDDWLVITPAYLLENCHLLQFCQDLRIVINMEQSDFESTQSLVSWNADGHPQREFIHRTIRFLDVASKFILLSKPPTKMLQQLLVHMTSLGCLSSMGSPNQPLQQKSARRASAGATGQKWADCGSATTGPHLFTDTSQTG